MIWLFFTYIIFNIFLIVKNYRTKNIIGLSAMLIGFSLAMFGLAFYTEYLSSSHYTVNGLYSNISNYIWKINYFLKLDINDQYRIMNIGTAIYIYGAICFSISFIVSKHSKRTAYFLLAIFPLVLIILFDPDVLRIIYKINNRVIFNGYVNSDYYIKVNSIIKSLAFLSNSLMKIYLVTSIMVLLYIESRIIPKLRKKFKYMIIGIIPIHFLFLVLFYWYPNQKIIFSRFGQLSNISIPYNEILYNGITLISVISVILLIYAILKYNIFEINVRKNNIDFEKQLHTANIGGRIFSHSVKNQLIAIRYLAEESKRNNDELLQDEIIRICNDTIEQISQLSKNMSKIKLKYSTVDINKIIFKKIETFKKMNPNITFNVLDKKNVSLNLDKKEFKKVMENIIRNSIEACSDMESPEITVVIDEKVEYGVIEIHDNGCGMDKKDIEKIFQPFYSTKATVSNWGIGLAYCQKVIEAFGGVIDVDSVLGEGTSFKLYIPNNRGQL